MEILSRLGLEHAVLSPGSRNAPLIKAFNQHPGIRCYSVVDERAAAFFALGMAQQLQKPVAAICTSGSALLNYGPAVVEAYHQRVPLLVISADRPIEWIGQGDGQAIDQKHVFRNFSKGYFELKESRSHQNSSWYNERSTAEAFNLAAFEPQGPVHLNIPLSEPLYGVEAMVPQLTSLPTKGIQSELSAPAASIKELANQVSGRQKVMLLIGQLHENEALRSLVHSLSELEQVVVLTETTSNLFGNGFIDQIDNALATFTEEEKDAFSPDLLITMGGMVVTKRLKQFLRTGFQGLHWHIDPATSHMDTYQKLSYHVQASPLKVLEALVPLCTSAASANYRRIWLAKKQLAGERHRQYCASIAHSDLSVFRDVLKSIPEGSQLQIGNSSPVRYVQLFENKTGVTHYCNRGVSGIDGCTGTAIGASVVNERPTVLISGEISFLYDNNSLWNKAVPANFVAIVVNNSGGNIFRIIEGPDQFSEMNEFIETTHSLSVKPLAELHGFRYLSADSEDSLQQVLQQTFDHSTKTILEVFTSSTESPAVLKKYWRFLKEGV